MATPPRGSVLYVTEESEKTTRYVLLTDIATLPPSAQLPTIGVVPLAQKPLPEHVLYPSVAGSNATGLSGVWRARADKLTAIYAKEFRAAGTVSGPELERIEAAVRAFLGL